MSISVSTLALAAATLGASGTTDTATPSDVEALQARVGVLEEQIEVLTGRPQGGWLTQDEEAVRALVNEVIAESEGRTSFRQNGAVAGHDGKFFLASPDGNFRLNFGSQVQFRYVFGVLDTADGSETDSTRGSFEMRRTKLTFDGHVFDPTVKFKVQGAFDRDGGGFMLEDAVIGKKYDEGWWVHAGQFKAPFLREELVSSKRQLAVERSLLNEQFNQDRSQGIELGHEMDNLRYMFMFSDGFGTRNTGATSMDTEYAFTGRLEWLVEGDSWSQFKDFTSWQDEETAFMLGGAAHIEQGEYGTPALEDQFYTWTVDASAEFGGSNVFGYFVGRHFDEADLDQYGFLVQGGIFLDDEWEVFGRYEWGDLDTMAEDLSVFTIGVNKYMHAHKLKWTTDFGFALDEIDSSWASSGAGWRTDDPDQDGQWVIRSQLQLLF